MKKIKLQRTAIIGYPLSHSMSPTLHSLLYTHAGISAQMKPIAHTDVSKLVNIIRNQNIGLTAVTMPFKESIIPHLDIIDNTAKAIGAVNTVINRNGKLTGYNTDAFGIKFALGNTQIQKKNVLIVGSGGAAKAAAFVIKKKGGKIIFANRTNTNAKKLQKIFGGRVLSLKKISSRNIDVIINATPLGMGALKTKTPVPNNILSSHQTVFDLIYNPLETVLIKNARKKGAKTISGIELFTAQGIRQVELWSGKKLLTKILVEKSSKKITKKLQ